MLAGLSDAQIPALSEKSTRGEFIRQAYSAAEKLGFTRSMSRVPRLHPKGLPNRHAPGEVDNVDLVKFVVADSDSLAGIVVDDVDAELIGEWTYSSHTPPYVGRGYLHDVGSGKGAKSARFVPTITKAGWYEVRLAHCANVRRTPTAPVKIHHADGETELQVNQQMLPDKSSLFKSLGRYRFEAGRRGWVEISNHATQGKVVIADAVQFLPD